MRRRRCGCSRRAACRDARSGCLWLVPLFVVRPRAAAGGRVPPDRARRRAGPRRRSCETRSYTLVYDTGPRFNETADAGGRIVAPFLRAAGAAARRRPRRQPPGPRPLRRRAVAAADAMPVGWLCVVAARRSSDRRARRRTARIRVRSPGQQWTWDGVRFTILHPTADEYDDAHAQDQRPVVRACASIAAHGSALLTGDIEARSEARARAQRRATRLRADVLVVPHHGSRTSSTPRVRARGARRASPSSAAAIAIASAIRAPTSSRATRIAASRVVRTDLEGAVTITFDGRATASARVRARAARRATGSTRRSRKARRSTDVATLPAMDRRAFILSSLAVVSNSAAHARAQDRLQVRLSTATGPAFALGKAASAGRSC